MNYAPLPSQRQRLFRNVNILILLMLICSLLAPVNQPKVYAEGSKQLNSTGGRRPNLLWSTSFVLGGIAGIATAPMKVYAKAGETISLGSSAVGIGSGKINYRSPTGASGTCGATGKINNYAEEQAGPAPNSGGYTPCIITSAQTTTAGSGVWEVDFVSPSPSASPGATPLAANDSSWTQENAIPTIRAWDITVRNAGGTTIPGRVFANNVPIYGGSFDTVDGVSPNFYVQTRDGYLYSVKLNGVSPGAATFFGNREGFTSTTTGNPLYASVPLTGTNPGTFSGTGTTVYNPNSADNIVTNDITHKIFFQTPAADLPTSAPSPTGQTWLLNAPVPPPQATNLVFTGSEGTPGQAGTSPLNGNYTFNVPTGGNAYGITMDLNRNGTFGDGNDRTLVGTTVPLTNTAYWNGLDSNGAPVAAGNTSYNASVTVYAGEVHFPFLDAENNYGGFVIQRLVGPVVNPNPNPYLVYYDDSRVCALGETTNCLTAYGTAPNPRVALSGVDSTNGVHKYGCIDGPDAGTNPFGNDECFGDRRAIDTWAYYPSVATVVNGAVVLKQADLVTTISHTPEPYVPGNNLQYTIKIKNNGPSDVTGVQVNDTLPASITGATWACVVTTGVGNCSTSTGTSNINTLVDLANGAEITFVVSSTVLPSASGNIVNTASATRPNDVNDPNTTNNSATDTATINTTGALNGVVFNDINGDSNINGSDSGIGGVSIELVNGSGTTIGTTATAPNGSYSFANVPAGSYTVRETDPAGYISISSNSVVVTVLANGTKIVNFADQQQGTVSGVVFHDLNGDRTQDPGEPGLSNVTITLVDKNGTPGPTTTTGLTGIYSFSNVTAGSYTVRETDPAGFISTTSNNVAISVAVGGSATANFADQQQGTVSGTVFNDINGNGLQDGNETGLTNVTIKLVDNTGTVTPTTTSLNGTYSFSNVTAGSYTVRETDPAGYTSTTANVVAISVVPGGAASAQFGDQEQGTVSGVVFNDVNGNGQYDSLVEQGLANVLVRLKNASTSQVVDTVTTLADGSYIFTGVTAGSYIVSEADPAGYSSTSSNSVTVNFLPGGSASANFGDQLQGSVSGTVFSDVDGSGDQDQDENGLGGVVVELLNSSGAVITTTTTVGNGSYSFTGITAGNYTVRHTVPTGYTSITDSSKEIIVPAGGGATANFADQQQGTVSGTVFSDVDGDGNQALNEDGLSGVTVRLLNDGTLITSTTTVGNGSYSFTGVTPGSYTVESDTPAGFTSTTLTSVDINVDAGGAASANFGYQQEGSVSGIVFSDTNGDGTQDGNENGLSGVAIELLDSDDAVITSTITVGDGSYNFTGVIPDSYTVRETVPTNYVATTNSSKGILVSAGGGATANFGNQQKGLISGEVFSDANGNGLRDNNELGQGGVTVQLLDSNNVVITSTLTVGDGSYSFAGIVAGSYKVRQLTPTGYTNTTPNSVAVNVGAGGSASANFGNQQQGTVSGTVFSDVNGSTVQDGNENGLGGVTIQLLTTNESVVTTTQTVGNGTYSFAGVIPGNYIVREIDPSGFVSTSNNSVSIYLGAGGTANADFGDQQQGTVSGEVFSDTNGNGSHDGSEVGLGGVKVELLNSADTVVDTTVTVGNGTYRFDNVTAGSYSVRETDPVGYTSITPNSVAVSVSPGGSATANFSDQQFGTVSGSVFSDTNGNGQQDGNESGIGAVAIQLVNQLTNAIITTTTFNDGTYSFANVISGTYTVEEIDPSGFVSTTNNSVSINVGANGSAIASFGDQQVGTISGSVFSDTDGDSVYGLTEQGVDGVGVELLDKDGNVITSTLSISGGSYIFTGVVSGTYTVRQTVPGGYINTTPTSAPVHLAAGGANTTNFGIQQQGTVSGSLFSDVNGDGIRNNSEGGIGGVTIELLDSAGNTINSTTTAGDGSYLFVGVTSGNYSVREVDPAGYISTTPNKLPVYVAPGGGASAIFGDQQQGSVSGVVFNDNNGDQLQGLDEDGLSGVTVELVDSNNTIIASTTTVANGIYIFSAVTAGTYSVRETDPSGFVSTTSNEKLVFIDAGGADTANFGDQQAGTIGGVVFHDLNGNGTQESGEPGLNGVRLQLFAGGTDPVAETFTNGNGTYTFPVVGAGSYTLVETDPSGFVSTTSNSVPLSVAPGGTANGQFGDQQVGSVSGTVFDDLNGNGSEDLTEAGIAGVTVDLVSTAGTVVSSTTTTNNGSFTFANVTPGAYTVRETDPQGYVSTTNNNVSISLGSAGAASAQFGDRQVGTVSGVVFDDADGNGTQSSSETGIGGVTIALVDPATSTTITTTTTTGNGTFLFTGIVAGTYQVRESVPPAYVATTSTTVPIILGPGGAATAQFGNQQAGLISGTVFNDLNADGTHNQSESGISGVTVELLAAGPDGTLGTGDDVVVDTTATIGDGSYIFTSVTPGSYLVRETHPDNYVATTSSIVSVTVAAGGSANGNFGNQQMGTITGTVFNDADGSGLQDKDEDGIGGLTVSYLSAGADATLGTNDDVVVATATTIGDGTYLFGGIVSGSYIVRITTPSGYLSTTGESLPVYVAPDGAATANFGYQQIGTVSGKVYLNLDGTGFPDGNKGVGGVTIQLLDANGNVVATAITADDGTYSFANIPAGTYSTRAITPSGYVVTTPNSVMTSVSSNSPATANFGLQQVGTVSGQVFYDLNGNGVPDPDEKGIGGITISLIDSNGVVVATTVTANDGSYFFTGIPLGNYTVQQANPDGVLSTTPNSIAVVVGGAAATANFGKQQVGAVSGEVFLDQNSNQQADFDEPGIGGVEIRLLDDSNSLIATTTTVGNGTYTFSGAALRRYRVVEIDPPGFVSTTPNSVDTTVTANQGGIANFGDNIEAVPAAISLLSFTAIRNNDTIEVRWVTSAEVDTWGFHLLRSEDGTRANAKRVTSELLLAKGDSQGGTYAWTDINVDPGTKYRYWLQEVELDGTIHEYGPITVSEQPSALPYRVTLPMVRK